MRNKLLLLFIIITTHTFAQNDSIQGEILKYRDTKSELINNGRKLLLQKFTEGDFNKVRQLKDYLVNDVQNEDYAAFSFMEYWLLLYWNQEYQELTQQLALFNSSTIGEFQRKIKPGKDLLFEKVLNKSRESEILLETFILTSDLNSEQKDFLSMNLKYLLTNESYPLITQDSINILADNFLKNYPGSQFETFTRQFIRVRNIPSKWAFAVEFFSGFGKSTDGLNEVFGTHIPLGITFDICYKKFNLYLRDYIGIGKTKADIINSNITWNKGSKYNLFLPEASLGYTLIDNKRIRLSPLAGISACFFTPTPYDIEKNPDLNDIELHFSPSYAFGLNLDLKLGPVPLNVVARNESNYSFIRFRYTYCIPTFERRYSDISGNVHTLTVGFGLFGQKVSRQK